MKYSAFEVAEMRGLKVVYSVFNNIEETLKCNSIKFVAPNDGEKMMGYAHNDNQTIFVLSENYRDSRNKFQETINRLKEIGLPIKVRTTNMSIEIGE